MCSGAVQPHIDAVARHPVFHQLTSITALFKRVDQFESDIMLVENFR